MTAGNNLLLTGLPGCGKTTVVRRLLERLEGLRLAGFYTEEIREHGRRLGFNAVGLGGRSAILAHVDVASPIRVGRYGVDLAAFEPLVAAELDRPADLCVIDEIGKMECSSTLFIAAVHRWLDSPAPVLAAIALHGGGFISEVKARPDVELVTVTPGNREQLPAQLAERLLSRAAAARRPPRS